jgi:cholesterol oxidase
MKRLSLPIEQLHDSYDAIVIGSGYGGGVAASRLARAGKRVCVLERGKELQPGDYPNTTLDLVKEVQSDLPLTRFGSATALFDIRYNADINVVVGCGLGGTSLINAGILLRPEPRIFEDACWPIELRNDQQMDRFFGYAEAMLKPATYPENWPPLAKTEALKRCAQSLSQECRPVPIAVNFSEFENDLNHVGVTQRPCINCGDCVSGCNHFAKNTVLMNYLPDAVNHGAEIYTELSARRIERSGGRWLVHYMDLRNGQESVLRADNIVLAAGTLGSTEILLRSKGAGLSLSGQVGNRFSTNGDTIGFAYNTDCAIQGVGFGSSPMDEMKPVGPCSTVMIDLRNGYKLEESMIVVDGAIPGAMAALLPATLSVAAKLTGTDSNAGLGDKLKEGVRAFDSDLLGAYSGAIKDTLFYLVVSQDDAAGQMYLEQDRLRIRWPGLGDQKQFAQASELMKRATAALGGTYIPNPVWNDLTNHNLVTGHPLGGCAMADDAGHGVVNHKSQVYDSESGNSVHNGLYVMDGAVIPRSLGVNPLLTISALAERSCNHLIQGN